MHVLTYISSESIDYSPDTLMQTGDSGALMISTITVKPSVEGTDTLTTCVWLLRQKKGCTERYPMVLLLPFENNTMDESIDVLSLISTSGCLLLHCIAFSICT